MASPTSRLLELLELLQTRPLTTGREIADRLGVDARTARRYIGVLQELGYPVEGQRGVGGGYRIRPGYRLPPLMLGDEEAVVVVLGLLATRGSGSDGSAAAVDGALAKINRVLPATLRRQVEALEETLGFTRTRGAAPADAGAVLLLADAIRRRRRLHTAYRTFSGEESERELSPYGLVVHSGRWYLAAHDHLRDDLRTFRVDRMWRTTLAEAAALAPPPGFDAVAHVTRSLASVPWEWEVEVCSTCRWTRRRAASPRRSPSSSTTPTGRSCACASTRSTGWRPSGRTWLRLHDPPAGRARGSVRGLAERLVAQA